jgi:hypothetical protein
MVFVAARRRIRIDLGHLLFVAAVGGYCLWYLFNARASSANFQNLVLIQPAVIVAVLLCAAIMWNLVAIEPLQPPAAGAGPLGDTTAQMAPAEHAEEDEEGDWHKVAVSMALMGAYLALIPVLGLDGATFVFLSASLFLQGERRISHLVLVPLVFAGGVIHSFKALLSIPIPTLLG